MITETTISGFSGFDPNGIPEFVRARKAMQYSASIDDYARIMKEGNNGGYANNWLVADRKTNEIASLELGLKNVMLQRTKDGFFVGSNFPADPKLIKEETDFDLNDQEPQRERAPRALAAADGAEQGQDRRGRRRRSSWRDHFDTFDGKTQAERAHAVRPHRSRRRAAWGRGSRRTRPPARCRTRSRTPPARRR